jgi:glutathione S-transferase
VVDDGTEGGAGTPLGGEVISDSTRIIAALETRHPTCPSIPPTRPHGPARSPEDFFDEELGPHIRRVFFFHLLQDPDTASATLTVGEPALSRRLYRGAFPLVRAVMRADMGIDAERSAQSRAKVEEALTRIESELQPSGYLVGDAFSVADLTAAALLAPLLHADEFPYRLPPLLPPLAAWRASVAERPGFRWAAEMYRRHRGASSEVAA